MERRTYTLADPDYPSRVRRLSNAPDPLTTSCDLATRDLRVAIVGSRSASAAGAAFARRLAAHLAGRGAIVVSGGALGIDAAAHEGALEVGGKTWLVAPTGPGSVTPPSHEGLFARVEASAGGVVWTLAPGATPLLHTFHERNEVLATLSDALVVVQAAAPRSGALSAGRAAHRLGIPVLTVCGWPGEAAHAGCLELLAEGAAQVLRSFDHALEAAASGALSPRPASPARPRRAKRARSGPPAAGPLLALPPPPLAPATGVLAHLSYEPQHIEKIAEASNLPLPHTLSELLTLALDDVVVEAPPGHYRRRY